MPIVSSVLKNSLLKYLLVACFAILMSGCSTVVRQRTLPPSVRSVYVPMIQNRTSEPGLEELLTVAVQREILADGRLDVLKEKDADATLYVTVTRFDEKPLTFDSDNFGTQKTYNVEAIFQVVENIPGRPAIGGDRDIEVEVFYNDDPRSTTFNPEPRERDEMARVFSQVLVLELMTGSLDDDEEFQPEPELDPLGEPDGGLSL